MRGGGETPEDWARGVQLSPPVRWGAIEDEVLRRRPAVEQTGADRAIRAVGLVLLAVICLPVVASSFIGLLLLRGDGPPTLVRLCFVAAAALVVAVLVNWWSERDRGPVRLLIAAGSGAVSLLAFLQLRSAPEPDGVAVLLTLAAAVLGLGGTVLMIVAARPDADRPRRRRWSLSPAKDLAYVQARERVLGILTERRVVTVADDQRTRMIQMPLGTWGRLDEDTVGR